MRRAFFLANEDRADPLWLKLFEQDERRQLCKSFQRHNEDQPASRHPQGAARAIFLHLEKMASSGVSHAQQRETQSQRVSGDWLTFGELEVRFGNTEAREITAQAEKRKHPQFGSLMQYFVTSERVKTQKDYEQAKTVTSTGSLSIEDATAARGQLEAASTRGVILQMPEQAYVPRKRAPASIEEKVPKKAKSEGVIPNKAKEPKPSREDKNLKAAKNILEEAEERVRSAGVIPKREIEKLLKQTLEAMRDAISEETPKDALESVKKSKKDPSYLNPFPFQHVVSHFPVQELLAYLKLCKS